MEKTFKNIENVVIRFAGDSGDGMQLAGGRFSDVLVHSKFTLVPKISIRLAIKLTFWLP